jgi:hypothetical protein
MGHAIDATQFRRLFADYQKSAWRWEQQPAYASDLEGGWPERWLAGEREPTPARLSWVATVRRQVTEGRTMERVRVIDDEETGYQRWADWSANYNRAGGEVIHRVTRSQANAHGLRHEPSDFWLLDDDLVVVMSFTPTHWPEGIGDESALALGLDKGLYDLTLVQVEDSAEALARAREVRDRAMAIVEEVGSTGA